jgi:hypothetical protein
VYPDHEIPNRLALMVSLALIGGVGVTTPFSARDPCRGAQRADCGVAVRGQFEILRAFADRDRAVKPMTVFGDPLFDPSRSGGDSVIIDGASQQNFVSAGPNCDHAGWSRCHGPGMRQYAASLALPQCPGLGINQILRDRLGKPGVAKY